MLSRLALLAAPVFADQLSYRLFMKSTLSVEANGVTVQDMLSDSSFLVDRALALQDSISKTGLAAARYLKFEISSKGDAISFLAFFEVFAEYLVSEEMKNHLGDIAVLVDELRRHSTLLEPHVFLGPRVALNFEKKFRTTVLLHNKNGFSRETVRELIGENSNFSSHLKAAKQFLADDSNTLHAKLLLSKWIEQLVDKAFLSIVQSYSPGKSGKVLGRVLSVLAGVSRFLKESHPLRKMKLAPQEALKKLRDNELLYFKSLLDPILAFIA